MGRERRWVGHRDGAGRRSAYRTAVPGPIRLVGGIVLDLDGLLRFAVEQGASDVHVKVGSRPRLRVDGRLREAPFDTVEPTDTERLAAAVIPRVAGRDVRRRPTSATSCTASPGSGASG